MESIFSNYGNCILLAFIHYLRGYEDDFPWRTRVIFFMIRYYLAKPVFLGNDLIIDAINNKIIRLCTARQQHRQQTNKNILFHILLMLLSVLYYTLELFPARRVPVGVERPLGHYYSHTFLNWNVPVTFVIVKDKSLISKHRRYLAGAMYEPQ